MIKHIDNIVDVSKLQSTNTQPVNEDQVSSLMASIREVGVHEAIKIYEVTETKERYIIAGHHRTEAIKRLRQGNSTIDYKLPAELHKVTSAELQSDATLIAGILSNMFRHNMSVLERAGRYKQLVDMGLSVAEVARRLSLDRKTISNGLATNDLPQEAKDWIKANKVTDSKVYSVATTYKREPSIDCIEKLSKAPAKKGKAKKLVNVDPDLLAEKLRKSKIGETTIKKVTSLLYGC